MSKNPRRTADDVSTLGVDLKAARARLVAREAALANARSAFDRLAESRAREEVVNETDWRAARESTLDLESESAALARIIPGIEGRLKAAVENELAAEADRLQTELAALREAEVVASCALAEHLGHVQAARETLCKLDPGFAGLAGLDGLLIAHVPAFGGRVGLAPLRKATDDSALGRIIAAGDAAYSAVAAQNAAPLAAQVLHAQGAIRELTDPARRRALVEQRVAELTQ